MNKDKKNTAVALSDDELEQAAGGFSIETLRFGRQTLFNLKNDGEKTLRTFNSMGDAKSAGAHTGEAYKKGNDRTIIIS